MELGPVLDPGPQGGWLRIALKLQKRDNLIFFIIELAKNDDFNKVVNVSSTKAKDGTREELVLKFLAYKTKRDDFKHSVEIFLNDFMADASVHFNYKKSQLMILSL